jgi:hypothetical protein
VLAGILGTLTDERVPFDLERAMVAETDDFMQERIVYTTRPGLQVSAYLVERGEASRLGESVTRVVLVAQERDPCLDYRGEAAGTGPLHYRSSAPAQAER